ncbi:queuosine precursor transporter [Hymenobacter lutimineralis]|uniref:Probable queuosine precursor transporter n=1 Tax=Hymenobacter lutimineralis TaxID=2606448 RepID=A0A5D6UY64_9BACT|nr:MULTISPECIES: queuosine precursor transporter [Hymenobacter]QIX60560.1 queuosine precursor transporter [Hymenobacter sp. BT18]TYZ07439.1 queuosine precursor transporter [Hymenobacter lutimineralis]
MVPTSSFAHKKQQLYLVLSGIFIVNALLAEIIGVKIFSVDALLGLPGNLTAGVLIWPVVFVTTDIINEYFGRKGVLRVSFLTVGLILYAFLVILATTKLPPAQFWLDINKVDAEGRPFNIEFAYQSIFRQGLGIITGSIVAFLIGQVLDATVFQALRRITGSRLIWLRATGSTLVSQLVDSFVVLFVAFYLFGNWSFEQVLSVANTNYWYKFASAILLTPVLYLAHYLIDRYLGQDDTVELQQEAAANVSV